MSVDKKIEEIWNEALDLHLCRLTDAHADLSRRCESPIEKLMLAALIAENVTQPLLRHVHFMGKECSWDNRPIDPFAGNVGVAQCKVGDYRADFLFEIQGEDKKHYLVVECDGHDFHERTKAQASRDRSRDRWMTERGITVFRFTGSEVWRDAPKCAEQVFSFIEDIYLGLGPR